MSIATASLDTIHTNGNTHNDAFFSVQYANRLLTVMQSGDKSKDYISIETFLADLPRLSTDRSTQLSLLTQVLQLSGIDSFIDSYTIASLQGKVSDDIFNVMQERESGIARHMPKTIMKKLGMSDDTVTLDGRVMTLTNYRGYDVSYRFGQQGRDELEISTQEGDIPVSFHIHEGVPSVNVQKVGWIEEFHKDLDRFINAVDSYRKSLPHITSSASLPVHKNWVQGRGQYTFRRENGSMHSIRIGSN